MTISDILFGCWHSNFGWPQGRGEDCRIVCVDCGAEFRYSLQEMKVCERIYAGNVIENLERTVAASVGGQTR